MRITGELAKIFASSFPIEEVKSYIAANQEEFLRWCEEEAQKGAQRTEAKASPPPKRRISRKGAAN